MGDVVDQKLRGIDLHFVMIAVGAGKREILLIFLGVLRLGCHRHIAFGFRISPLHFIGEQILHEQPGSQHLLRIRLVEEAYRRSLGDHVRIVHIKLGNHAHSRVKVHDLVGTDIGKRCA